jgi:Family of unknown function (DUF6982)
LQARAKVVVAYLDGRRLKGYTNDFSPARDQFFLFPEGQEPKPGERGTAIRFGSLKAVFFVKDFAGNPDHQPVADPTPMPGKKMEVTFADNETMRGTTVAYNAKALGFFLQPLDRGGNNERVFIVNQNVRSVRVL